MSLFSTPAAANEAQVIGAALGVYGSASAIFKWLAARKLAKAKKKADDTAAAAKEKADALLAAEKKGADELLARQLKEAAESAAKASAQATTDTLTKHAASIAGMQDALVLNAADNLVILARLDQLKPPGVEWSNGARLPRPPVKRAKRVRP